MLKDIRKLRVALCQLHYHPATRFQTANGDDLLPLKEPIWTQDTERACVLGALEAESDDRLDRIEAFRTSLMKVYLTHLERRLGDILRFCKEQDAQLVIFPEFSIPGELLLELRKIAKGMTVVFGSHMVTRDLLEKKPGVSPHPWERAEEGFAIVPILLSNGSWASSVHYRPGKAIYWSAQDQPISIAPDMLMLVLPGDPLEGEKPEPEDGRLRRLIREGTVQLIVGPCHAGSKGAVGSGFYHAQGERDSLQRHFRLIISCSEAQASRSYIEFEPGGSSISLTASNDSEIQFADRLLLADVDLNAHGPSMANKVLATVVVPAVRLPGQRDVLSSLIQDGENTAAARKTTSTHHQQIEQWREVLSSHGFKLFQQWRKRLRQLTAASHPLDPVNIREAIGGYLPLSAGTLTAKGLDISLGRAAAWFLENHVMTGNAREMGRKKLSVLESQIGPGDTSKAESDLIRQVEGEVRQRFEESVGAVATTSSKPIRIRSIHIIGIRGLQNLNMKLDSGDADTGQWILLLGDNGIGKTTVLRAVVLTLLEEMVANSWFTREEAPYIGLGLGQGSVHVTFEDGSEQTDLESELKERRLVVTSAAKPWVLGETWPGIDNIALGSQHDLKKIAPIDGGEMLQWPGAQTDTEDRSQAEEPRTSKKDPSGWRPPFPIFAYGSHRGTAMGGGHSRCPTRAGAGGGHTL